MSVNVKTRGVIELAKKNNQKAKPVLTLLNSLKKQALQGDRSTQFLLGDMYYIGRGVPKDYKEAVKWYTKAAKQGNIDAQYNLGLMYTKKQGVPQDYKKALKWWTMAAEQGYAIAQYGLGYMYYIGRGVPRDYKEAVKWYTKAAEQGHAVAQNSLGFIYSKGKGVPKDYVKAYKWFILAAPQEQQGAIKFKDLLEQTMSREQIAEAQKLARKFKPIISSQQKDTDMPTQPAEQRVFYGFIPRHLDIKERLELNVFPLNVLFAQWAIQDGEKITGSALYEPDLKSFKQKGTACSMVYRNIYGGKGRLVIEYNSSTKIYRGEKFVGRKLIGSASDTQWNQFFGHFTSLGLADGESCKFTKQGKPN